MVDPKVNEYIFSQFFSIGFGFDISVYKCFRFIVIVYKNGLKGFMVSLP